MADMNAQLDAANLTDRQKYCLIGKYHDNLLADAIADRLACSARTVRGHIEAALRKLDSAGIPRPIEHEYPAIEPVTSCTLDIEDLAK